MNRTKMKKKK